MLFSYSFVIVVVFFIKRWSREARVLQNAQTKLAAARVDLFTHHSLQHEIERTRTNHFKFCARAVGEYVLKCRRDGSIRIIILSRVINGDTSTSDAGYERSRENAR